MRTTTQARVNVCWAITCLPIAGITLLYVVIHQDTGGMNFWEEVEEWLKEKKEDAQNNGNGTVTVGLTIAGAYGLAGSYSTGITFDRKGNIGMVGTINGGAGFPSAGAGGFATITNAPNIFAQEGLGTAVRGSVGPGAIAVGGEYNQLIDTKKHNLSWWYYHCNSGIVSFLLRMARRSWFNKSIGM